jgi:hypothetical protein
METEAIPLSAYVEYNIPDHMVGSIESYILHGSPPGQFLTAVISNDLKQAVSYADNMNQLLLPHYVKLLYNHAPMDCWGSEETMKSWIDRHKLKRNEPIDEL